MVYLITDGYCTKIGVSKTPLSRIKGLQTSCPKKLYFQYVYNLPNSIEKRLHNHFKDYKTESGNEWFDFSKVDIETLLKKTGIKGIIDTEMGKFNANKLNNIKANKTEMFTNQVMNSKKQKLKHLVPKANEIQLKIRRLLEDIRIHLEIMQNKRISYQPYINKYGFKKEEISYFVKSANLSSKVSLHNSKLG